MTKKILFLGVIAVNLFSATNTSFENNIGKDLVIVEATDEDLKKVDIHRNVQKDGKLIDESKQVAPSEVMKSTDYTDAILLNFISASGNEEGSLKATGTAKTYKSKYDKTDETATKTADATVKKDGVNNNSLVAEANQLKGYTYITADCVVEKNYDITNETIMETFCQNKTLGYFKLISSLTPKVEGKIAGLFGEPKSIEDFNGNEYALTTTSKLVNKYTGNTNLATWANKRKLEEWISSSSIYSAQRVSESSKAYMQELKESHQKQQLSASPLGATTVITNNEKPDVMDTVLPTTVDIISNTIKEGLVKFQADLPYLYRIEKNTKFKLYANIKKIEE